MFEQVLNERDMEVHGNAVLSFFSSSILVMLFKCGIAVSSRPALCGFCPFG